MRRLLAFVALAFTAVALACSGNEATGPSFRNQPAVGTPAEPPPDFASADDGAGLSITTDKDDYQPGDTVWFTGAGWRPGDTLDIVLLDEPVTHAAHTWWIPVNDSGGFRDSTYVVDVGDLGVTFTLTASSRTNPAQSLTVQFTDGNPGPPFVAVGGAQSPNPVTAGNSATYTIQINYTGTNVLCTVNLSATPTASPAWPAPPPAGFFGFSPVSVTGKGTGGGGTAINPQSTLTVTTPAGMAANTYQFTVTRTRNQQTGETCQGALIQTSTPINLVVAAPSDVGAPVVTNVQATPNPANGTVNVVLTATATDAVNKVTLAEYNIDGGTFTGMTASDGAFDELAEDVTATIAAATVAALSDGNHTLCVRATDQLGNQSGDATACTILVVDQTPPVVTNVQAAPNPANGTVNVVLTATATDVLTNVTSAEYNIDGGSFAGMAASDGLFDELAENVTVTIAAATVAALSDGNHTLCVRATDAVANRSGDVAACTTLVVDQTPPVVTNVQAAPNPANGTVNVVLTATATDAVTNVTSAEYNLDGGIFTGMTASDGAFDELAENVTATIAAATVAALSDGNHTLCVRATDAVANRSGDVAACTTLVVDQTPPVVTNVQAAPNPANGTVDVVLSATATDALTNVTSAEYNIDGGSFAGMAASDGLFDELAENVTVTIAAATVAALSDGNHTLCVRATDAATNRSDDTAACTTLLVDQTPPVVTNVAATPNPTNGTVNVVLTATATDALTKVTSAEYNIDGGSFSGMAASDGLFDELAEDVTATIAAATVGALSSGNHSLCVRATDAVANRSGATVGCITLIVDKVPPAISNFNVSPNPVAVNTLFTISATFTDALTNVSGAEYSLDGTAGPWLVLPNAGGSYDSNTETGSITISRPNADVFDVCVRSTDQVGNTNQTGGTNPIQCIFLAVYDPTAGFVTGGGWIMSPLGAYLADPSLTGKATFGFVSKYQKGANLPTGNTEFQFHAGSLDFKSTTYEWLVVSQNGARAQYKGYGTVNGQAGYGFMLTALDQSPDQFRIKIWSTGSGGTVYDNRLGSADSSNDATTLGGGSIMIHIPKR